MKWSAQDPVSEKEIARNNAVYDIQYNRNPFIDYPGLEQWIWGDKMDVPFQYEEGASNIRQLENHCCEEQWFLPDGRKLQGKPTRKGLYVNRGRKMLVK